MNNFRKMEEENQNIAERKENNQERGTNEKFDERRVFQNLTQLEESRRRDIKQEENKKSGREEKEGIEKKIKRMAEFSNPFTFVSLVFHIDPTKDWPYVLALIMAIFKDFLDLLEVIPILYVVIIVITFCVSIFIGLMMILANALEENRQSFKRSAIKKMLTLFLGASGEIILGANFVPMETITVLIIYTMTLMERKEFSKKQKTV